MIKLNLNEITKLLILIVFNNINYYNSIININNIKSININIKNCLGNKIHKQCSYIYD